MSDVIITEVDLKAALAAAGPASGSARAGKAVRKPRKSLSHVEPAHSERNAYRKLQALSEQAYVATFVISERDPERLNLFRQIITTLPALVDRVGRDRIEEKLAQYVSLMANATPLERVRLNIERDNLHFRDDFVKHWECWDSPAVHKLSGAISENSAQTAARWKARRKIFAVNYADKQLFPAFQFRDGRPVPTIRRVLMCFGDQLSPWQVAAWFVSSNAWLDDATPVSRLATGASSVVEAAKREVEQHAP